MRILLATPAFPPSGYGGVSAYVGALAKGLATRGHEVRVVTTNRYDLKRVMEFNGKRESGGFTTYYGRAHWPSQFFFAPRVVQVLAEWIPLCDVVHVHDTRTFVGLVTSLSARRMRVPLVLTCHGSLNPLTGSVPLKALYDHVLGNALVTSASRVIALNEAERSDIVDFGVPPERVTIVPNAVPMVGGGDAEDVSGQMPAGKQKTVLYLGRIHPIKGIDRLVNSFALTVAHHRECRLLVVGQDYGAQRSLVKQVRALGIEENVAFPGPVYGAAKEDLLRNSSVLVLPSYADTFPLVVLEALSAGIPVVVSAECGIAAELQKEHAALVASSVPGLADAIERCLYQPEVVDSLRHNGYRLLKTRFNWSEVLSQVEKIYEGVVRRRPGSEVDHG